MPIRSTHKHRRDPGFLRLVAGLYLTMLLGLLFVGGCFNTVPRNIDNGCSMFSEKHRWFRAARASEKRWGVPMSVQLAIIHQESRFRAHAKPARRKILWVIPGPRLSSSYGYTQALSSTWSEYQRATRSWGADRNDFADAVDFIGWYTNRSAGRLGIARSDAYRLYLAYHEGDGGYRRGTYANKPTIKRAAVKVRDREATYRRQLAGCRKNLEKQGRWFW
jgi:hypothetical protein